MLNDRPHSVDDLFRHVSADKAAFYRAVMETFALAKRQFRLHLRPDGTWSRSPPQGALRR